VGITLNFGIIADTTANPASFIYDRVLGTTPESAAARVTAAVEASKNMTLSTLKHFPGHGETIADSHQTIPTIPLAYDQWLARDKPPFAAGIDAGADVVMAGHLRYSAVDSRPASLSKKWHDILRLDLGFKGVVITDAMGMLQDSGDPTYADAVRNAVLALQAGNTMLLYVTDPAPSPQVLIDGIVVAVKSGQLSESTITQAAKIALELRSKSAALVK
jgi:beta-N-acetylhexosaminidase